MTGVYDQEQPPDGRAEIPLPLPDPPPPHVGVPKEWTGGPRQSGPRHSVLYHRGDAYGWLGFWLAVGIIVAAIFIAAQWSHSIDNNTLLRCAYDNLQQGVCSKP